MLFRSDPTPEQLNDSGLGGYCWEHSRPVVADVDGDGRDDIVTLYDYGTNDSGLWVFRSTGSALAASSWWHVPGRFDAARAALSTGDFDGDGRDDVAIAYATGADGSGRQVWSLHSTGTAFADPALGWQEPAVGAVSGPHFDIEHRTYELVARPSGRCLEVAGSSTTDGAPIQQRDCQNGLNQRWRLDRVPGTDRFELKAAHSVKCAGVSGRKVDDGTAVIQWSCVGSADQQIELQYVEGSSYDTVVRLVFGHSGKCAEVAGGALDNGTAIVQNTCTDAASQQWVLRAALNTPQLNGRFRIRSTVAANRVVDVAGCAKTDGADVRMWVWVATSPCQKWRILSLGDDSYQILNDDTGKSLDVPGCSDADGASVYVWSADDSPCQRWRIEPAAGGTYSILALGSGKSVTVAGGSTAENADVTQSRYVGGASQGWYLDPE